MPGGSAWRGRATRPPWATARSSAASSEGEASRYTSVPLPDTWARRGLASAGLGHYRIEFTLGARPAGLWVLCIPRMSRVHELRLNGRDRGLVHVGEPTWADVQRRRTEYAAWSDEVLEFDTAGRTTDEVALLLITRFSKS